MSLGQRPRVAELAQGIFNAVVDHYAAAGVDIEPLPTRRYVAAGDANAAAWDCEQFTVSCQLIGWGPAPDSGFPSAQSGAGVGVFGMRHAIFAAQLVRCVTTVSNPDGEEDFPDPADLNLDGLRFMRDAGMLSQALVELASRLRQGLDRGVSIQTGDVIPVGPDGGFVGAVAGFSITLGSLV